MLSQELRYRRMPTPAIHRPREPIDLIGWQAQRFGHVAHRASAAIAVGHRRHRGAVSAIALEHVLDDLLAAFVFEIDVDVRRLIALA